LNNRFNEYIMTGLRTIWGISFLKIEKEFGEKYLQILVKNSQTFIDNGLLKIQLNLKKEKTLITTKKGKFLADGIASDLFII